MKKQLYRVIIRNAAGHALLTTNVNASSFANAVRTASRTLERQINFFEGRQGKWTKSDHEFWTPASITIKDNL